jgi:hypothetical protein
MKRYSYCSSFNSLEEWNAAIDEMIWTFDYIVDPDKYNPFPNIKFSNFNNGDTYTIFNDRITVPGDKEKWENYLKKSKELDERRNAGLILYATHFNSLWD